MFIRLENKIDVRSAHDLRGLATGEQNSLYAPLLRRGRGIIELHLDISNVGSPIDSGTVPFDLSAYLGGYLDQRDNATFSALFLNGGTSLGSSTLGPVTLADRNGITELLFRSTSGFIPAGTRQIDFRVVMTGIDGSQNDGYADNLSFIARGPSSVPEPGSMGLLALGLGDSALACSGSDGYSLLFDRGLWL